MDKNFFEYELIADWIKDGSTILDLGCGDGKLMLYLKNKKNTKAYGIEISDECIYNCVEKGLSVFHSDIEAGLKDFPNKSFDFVILHESLQQIRNLNYVLREALRVGKKVIVSFPNFAFIDSRVSLFFKGKAPVTKKLPYRWDNTPNVHFFSIKDFSHFCKNNNIKILNKYSLKNENLVKFLPNIFADRAIFKIKEK